MYDQFIGFLSTVNEAQWTFNWQPVHGDLESPMNSSYSLFKLYILDSVHHLSVSWMLIVFVSTLGIGPNLW